MTKPEGRGRRILAVDDDKENLSFISELLATEGHSITSVTDGETALRRIKAWKPHVILLDINMPGITGLELIPVIRTATEDDYVPIVLVSANMTLDSVKAGLAAGADDYLTKPFRAQEILSRVTAMLRLKDLQDGLRRANHRTEELLTTDEITGLLNMRVLNRRGQDELQRSLRFHKPVSALVVNLDGFAEVNDKAGYTFGNKVLQDVAKQIRASIRSMDLAARIGADEYVLVLPETDLASGEFIAERIRDGIQGLEIKADKLSARLTACVGVAGLGPDVAQGGLEELLRYAREALRAAKATGPNQIEIYSFA